MTLKQEENSHNLTDDEINEMFERFSFPMVRPCITSSQKQISLEISKCLWLRLVSGTDTDENIYDDLKGVFGNKNDSITAIGSLYLFTMKTTLTEAEINSLKNHYKGQHKSPVIL